MATMVSEVYDAFVEAGASQDKARKAAEAIAGFDTRAVSFEQAARSEINDVKREIIGLRGEMTLLKWMVGFNTALGVAILARLFFVSA